nr:MAG: MoxR family ATPase [Chloroflexota bacterium]
MEQYLALPDERPIEDPALDPIPERLEAEHLRLTQREVYRADPALVEAVNLAIALGRPLLLQGEPGCGKTRLAFALAYALGLPLEVSPIKSTSRAQDLLYTYDAVRRLYDAELAGRGKDGRRAIETRNYITLGPLGRAIQRATYGRRSVVLIDEIDKADLDFPNDLLWELDRLEFRVTEAPELHYAVSDPALRPIVIVTHNEEKALPSAFLRRCIFHYISFPEREDDLWQILAAHRAAGEALGRRAIEVLLRLRAMPDLAKKPGISELLDWAGYLAAIEAKEDELDAIPYIGALLKQHSDQGRARQTLQQP